MRQGLESAGFFINKAKSVWEPSRRLTWLGFVCDLNTFSLEIPLEKIMRFKNDIILAISELSVLTARSLKSSTYRELKAAFITLFSLPEVFQNRLVNIYTYNQNIVRITNTGSMKSELQSLAIEIFNLCIRKHISIEVEWIPREQNQTADAYSKVFDYDD